MSPEQLFGVTQWLICTYACPGRIWLYYQTSEHNSVSQDWIFYHYFSLYSCLTRYWKGRQCVGSHSPFSGDTYKVWDGGFSLSINKYLKLRMSKIKLFVSHRQPLPLPGFLILTSGATTHQCSQGKNSGTILNSSFSHSPQLFHHQVLPAFLPKHTPNLPTISSLPKHHHPLPAYLQHPLIWSPLTLSLSHHLDLLHHNIPHYCFFLILFFLYWLYLSLLMCKLHVSKDLVFLVCNCVPRAQIVSSAWMKEYMNEWILVAPRLLPSHLRYTEAGRLGMSGCHIPQSMDLKTQEVDRTQNREVRGALGWKARGE